jgi:hypothetical protein
MDNAPKRLAAAAAQLRTNHALTGPYLRRIKKRVTSYCACGLQASREHLLKECRRFNHVRPPEWRKCSVKSILGNGNEEERLLDYIRDSEVGIRPPDEILDTPMDDENAVHPMDTLNEFMEFMEVRDEPST